MGRVRKSRKLLHSFANEPAPQLENCTSDIKDIKKKQKKANKKQNKKSAPQDLKRKRVVEVSHEWEGSPSKRFKPVDASDEEEEIMVKSDAKVAIPQPGPTFSFFPATNSHVPSSPLRIVLSRVSKKRSRCRSWLSHFATIPSSSVLDRSR